MSGFRMLVDPFALNIEQRRAIAAFIINPSLEDISGEDNPQPQAHEVFNVQPPAPAPVAVAAPPAAPAAVAVPAPPAPAPVATNVVTMPASNELDENGLPWDARIHSANKTKSEDGTWRRKRGIADSLFDQVTAELKGTMSAPGPVAVPAPPASAPVAVAAPPAPAPAAVAVPAPPAPAPVAVGADRDGYVQLITKASAAIAAKKIVKEELDGICGLSGVPSLPALANRLDLVPQVSAALDQLLAGR